MNYAGIIYNDFSAGPGVCLSFFTQGCHFQCKNCHNPQAWDFQGGKEFTDKTLQSILKGLKANGIHRDFAVLGGEPLCPENLFLTRLVISNVKEQYPDTKIYIWTGYLYEQLLESSDHHLKWILENADILIDGPFVESERDITLTMRGSRNQRIINLHTGEDITNDF